jgi:hypothetical protein
MRKADNAGLRSCEASTLLNPNAMRTRERGGWGKGAKADRRRFYVNGDNI